MKRIYKYIVEPFNAKVVMPLHSTILKVGCIHEEIFVWAQVDVGQKKTEIHYFDIYGTGHDIRYEEGVSNREYIDTVFMGKLVFHIFEKYYSEH